MKYIKIRQMKEKSRAYVLVFMIYWRSKYIWMKVRVIAAFCETNRGKHIFKIYRLFYRFSFSIGFKVKNIRSVSKYLFSNKLLNLNAIIKYYDMVNYCYMMIWWFFPWNFMSYFLFLPLQCVYIYISWLHAIYQLSSK